MKAVILAAGEGKRMRPFTLKTPKPLLPVLGRPFLDYIFDALPDEISEVVIVVKYLGDKIRAYCGSVFKGKTIHYAEGSDQGSAFSFLAARPFIADQERIMIIYGDELLLQDEVTACLAYENSWLCYEVPDPTRSGIAIVDSGGYILEVIEKPQDPKSNLAATGLMIANADIFSYKPVQHANSEYYLSSMMSEFCKHHPVMAVRGAMDRPQFTTPDDIVKLENLLQRRDL